MLAIHEVEVRKGMTYLDSAAMVLKVDLVERVDFMERVGRRSESGGGGGVYIDRRRVGRSPAIA